VTAFIVHIARGFSLTADRFNFECLLACRIASFIGRPRQITTAVFVTVRWVLVLRLGIIIVLREVGALRGTGCAPGADGFRGAGTGAGIRPRARATPEKTFKTFETLDDDFPSEPVFDIPH
jgi:hypothetical protein